MLNLSLPQNLAHPPPPQHVTKLPIELRLRPANKSIKKYFQTLILCWCQNTTFVKGCSYRLSFYFEKQITWSKNYDIPCCEQLFTLRNNTTVAMFVYVLDTISSLDVNRVTSMTFLAVKCLFSCESSSIPRVVTDWLTHSLTHWQVQN